MNGSQLISSAKNCGEEAIKKEAIVFSPTLKTQIINKASNLLASTQNIFSSPLGRNLFMMVVVILVSSTNIFAAKELKEVINDFSKFIYEDVRFAICILGLAYAGVRFWSKDDNGRTQAFYIIIGVGIFAFGPGIIDYIAALTDTTRPEASTN